MKRFWKWLDLKNTWPFVIMGVILFVCWYYNLPVE